MSSKTPNYNLHKIDLTDAPPDITVLNPNWDTLDEQLKNLADSIANKPAVTVDSALSNTSTNAIQNKVVKAALDDKLPLAGGTVTGTLILSKVADADGDAYTDPALVVGGEPDTYHLELDNNEIQAKQNETTPGNLFLNSNGGKVTVGEGGLETDGNVWPTTALVKDVGTAALPWNNLYGRYFNLYGAANTQYGRFRVGTTGTTSTEGTATLELGNATATGTAHNSSGKITVYGKGTGFTNILPNTATSGSNSVYLPTGTGTLMLDTEGCKVQTGSYNGTGTSGSSSKNSLTLNFVPKFVTIFIHDSNKYQMELFNGKTSAYASGGKSAATVSWSSKTVSWYASDVGSQMNQSGENYRWVALG